MKAELYICSDSLHTCGVITGFYMLAIKGELELDTKAVWNKNAWCEGIKF